MEEGHFSVIYLDRDGPTTTCCILQRVHGLFIFCADFSHLSPPGWNLREVRIDDDGSLIWAQLLLYWCAYENK